MKKLFFLLIVAFIAAIYFKFFTSVAQNEQFDFNVQQKIVAFSDSGLVFDTISNAQTVDDFLREQKISLSANDVIFPQRRDKIFVGSRITILRAKKVTIKEGGSVRQVYTLKNTIEQAVWEDKNINLGDDDITVPSRETLLKDGMAIVVTHVLIKEEIKQENIDYKTTANEDDSLGWRIKKVTQKGEKGIKNVKYKVVSHDGKEISRKVLETTVIKDPVTEIVTQGTFMKLGKAAKGQGTWYAWKGGLFAASTTLVKGTYAKVTNTANGKSVVVQINDYGPQGKGRIIDLDKVAFQQIASLGAGVIGVEVESILN